MTHRVLWLFSPAAKFDPWAALLYKAIPSFLGPRKMRLGSSYYYIGKGLFHTGSRLVPEKALCQWLLVKPRIVEF